MEQREHNIVAYQVEYEVLDPALYTEEDTHADLDDPIAYLFKATADPDTMYHHEAMREPDAHKFRESMVKEVNDHTQRDHWAIMLKKDLPDGEIILPAVWSMKRKRRIATQEPYKWKSRLNLGGHKMIPGKHYDETYAPALSWPIIRLFLILSLLHGWKTRQLDFILAYPQAPVVRPTFMELPKGINFPGLDRNKHCLRVKRNINGGKDAGRTWYLYLKKGLLEIGFQQSRVDECVFYRGTTILLIYTDDCILLDRNEAGINKAIKDLQSKFSVQDEGNLEDYLGVLIRRQDDGSIHLSQPHLIDSILKDLGLIDSDGKPKKDVKEKDMPALTTKLIGPDPDGPEFDYDWSYRSAIGRLNFLEKCTRLDISYVTHQCARFTANPKRSHGAAVKHLARYLLSTRDKGMVLRPDDTKSLECFVDADFLGNWDKRIASNDPDTARSRTGYIITYGGTPIHWASKLQTQFALSTAESEFLALSTATRYVKSLMFLLDELHKRNFKVSRTPTIYCKVFEDNVAALEIARVPKLRPRTRHLNCIYHHFRNEVANKRIRILPIRTKEQPADIMTKLPSIQLFFKHRDKLMGWTAPD